MSMNADVKALWVKDLRDNPDAQGTGYLDYVDEDGKRRQCCLGRLCLLAVKAEVIPEGALYDGGLGATHYEYGIEATEILLPAEVMQWAGLHKANPMVDRDKLPKGVTWDTDPDDDGDPCLANANDGGTSFAVIADIIDQQF